MIVRNRIVVSSSSEADYFMRNTAMDDAPTLYIEGPHLHLPDVCVDLTPIEGRHTLTAYTAT